MTFPKLAALVEEAVADARKGEEQAKSRRSLYLQGAKNQVANAKAERTVIKTKRKAQRKLDRISRLLVD